MHPCGFEHQVRAGLPPTISRPFIMRPIHALLLAGALASGCASTPLNQPQHTIQAAWQDELATHIAQTGPNSVKGSGFMRQRGGGVVTCAGSQVSLIPATPYAIERLRVLYGSSESGTNQVRAIKFIPDPPGYYSHMRQTKCDAQGNFNFEGVPDGDYFITLTVSWTVGYSAQGGNLMQRVRLSGGKAASVVMSA